MTSDKMIQYRLEKELEERNRYLTDEDLNAVLPGIKDGYEVLYIYYHYKEQILHFFSNLFIFIIRYYAPRIPTNHLRVPSESFWALDLFLNPQFNIKFLNPFVLK